MQYVGRAMNSMSKTWNSINPSTLSGAIDVVVVKQPDGDLHCSAFHIRFGKLSLLRPSEKGVDFYVNDRKIPIQMKLGEGGEAFFVFETAADVPPSLLTSPVLSPQGSPSNADTPASGDEDEMEELQLSQSKGSADGDSNGAQLPDSPTADSSEIDQDALRQAAIEGHARSWLQGHDKSDFDELVNQLCDVKVPSTTNDQGHVIIDMTGYKPGGQNTKALEDVVQQILSHDLSHVPTDDTDLPSAPSSPKPEVPGSPVPADGEEIVPSSPPGSPGSTASRSRHFVKTLRLTSDMLKELDLKPGANDVKFVVRSNQATVTSSIFYWDNKTPVVVSDIDGTITRSDALGHVMTMIGRDWTHAGVAKLFTDIHNNGYNILYLTSRAVGQSDVTKAYLNGIEQDGYRLPKGPVILSPDRLMAALRREVIMRKPEIFKMACLKDISKLYDLDGESSPFYAGFGNRITDALSYRSVGIPSTKIFTINTNSEVHMELLELTGLKSTYMLINDLTDHFFPPATQLAMQRSKTTEFTDANFWRAPLAELSDDYEDETATGVASSTNGDIDYEETFGCRPTFGGVDDADSGDDDDDDDDDASYFSDDAFSDQDDDDELSADEEADYVPPSTARK